MLYLFIGNWNLVESNYYLLHRRLIFSHRQERKEMD